MWMKKQTITLESITCSELNLQIDKNQVQLQTSFSKQKLNDNKKIENWKNWELKKIEYAEKKMVFFCSDRQK